MLNNEGTWEDVTKKCEQMGYLRLKGEDRTTLLTWLEQNVPQQACCLSNLVYEYYPTKILMYDFCNSLFFTLF